jgi:hypothetical protein
MFEVACECGNTIPVRAGQAGGTVACRCGRVVSVPALSQLRQAAAEAGRSTRPPPARHDWRAWWLGVGLAVTGELTQTTGFILAGTSSRESFTLGLIAFMAIVVGYVLLFVGIFVVGLGKGFAMWFCLLLFFCVPLGRLVILFFPGKGMDETP